MIVEHSLELGDMPVDEVGRVGYFHFDVVVPVEQQRQIPPDAQVCAA